MTAATFPDPEQTPDATPDPLTDTLMTLLEASPDQFDQLDQIDASTASAEPAEPTEPPARRRRTTTSRKRVATEAAEASEATSEPEPEPEPASTPIPAPVDDRPVDQPTLEVPVTRLMETMPFTPRATLGPPPDVTTIARDPQRRTLRDALRATVVEGLPTGPMKASAREGLGASSPLDSSGTMPTPTPYAPDYRSAPTSALPSVVAYVYHAPRDGKALSWLAWRWLEWELRYATWRMEMGGLDRLREIAHDWMRRDVEEARRAGRRVAGRVGAWRNSPLYQFALREYGLTLNQGATHVVFATHVRCRRQVFEVVNGKRQLVTERATLRVRAWRAPRWVTETHHAFVDEFGASAVIGAPQLWWVTDTTVRRDLTRRWRETRPAWRVSRASLFLRTLTTLWALVTLFLMGMPQEGARLLAWLRILPPRAQRHHSHTIGETRGNGPSRPLAARLAQPDNLMKVEDTSDDEYSDEYPDERPASGDYVEYRVAAR